MIVIFRKIFGVTIKFVTGVFILYLFLSWAVVPLAVPRVIQSQGTKHLKTPVRVTAAAFNPFLWRFSLEEMELLDANDQTLAGFDALTVDISFLSLLKGIYRVEGLVLDGINVNVVLRPDGTINLLGLLPAPTAGSESPEARPEDSSEETPFDELPLVIINDISVTNGWARFTDESLEPHFVTTLSALNIHVTGFSTRSDSLVDVVLETCLDERGVISSEAHIAPFVQPLRMEASFVIDQYAMGVLSPYTGKYTGRELADGNLTLRLDYRIADHKISAGHKLLIQSFAFGKKVDSQEALNLPFGMAVALLEDPQGRITISLPVEGNMNDPEFKYAHLLGQVTRNFFLKLVTRPFSFLGSMVGSEMGEEEFGIFKFVPAKTELSAEDSEQIKILAKALLERPRLTVEINGAYDPDADWKMMKTEVFNKDFATLQAESTRPESWIYQQLYQRQFGVRDLWELTGSHKSEDSEYDETALNAAMKTAIIEYGSLDEEALKILAETRAKVIYDALAAAGFDEKRMTRGPVKVAPASMGFVPLEITLKVPADSSFGETQ